jgi:type I restriction enzyme S subunit
MGYAAVVKLTERFALAQRVICFQPYGAIESSFLVLQILSDEFQRILEMNATGMTAKGIKAAKLRRLPFAVPPLTEQQRIVAKVDQLMALVDQLEAKRMKAKQFAEAFAQAAVTAITGTDITERRSMKPPRTEVVSNLKAKRKPKNGDDAPLAKILAKQEGELAAKTLWEQSGLEIGDFYLQLRAEITKGWIQEPPPATVREIEAS